MCAGKTYGQIIEVLLVVAVGDAEVEVRELRLLHIIARIGIDSAFKDPVKREKVSKPERSELLLAEQPLVI
jgi:hypothetical protein